MTYKDEMRTKFGNGHIRSGAAWPVAIYKRWYHHLSTGELEFACYEIEWSDGTITQRGKL